MNRRNGMRNSSRMANNSKQLILLIKNLNILFFIVSFFLVVIFSYIAIFSLKYFFTDCYLKKGYFSYMFGFNFNNVCVHKYKPASYKDRKKLEEKEVFHINNQNLSYKQAKCKCAAYNARLATKNEIIKSYNKGAHWCTYGWSEGQRAYYPVQKCNWDKLQRGPKKLKFSCGRPGVNGGYFSNPELKFGANCYGVKPKGSVANPKKPHCEEPEFCEAESNHDASNKLDTDIITGFNDKRWSKFSD